MEIICIEIFDYNNMQRTIYFEWDEKADKPKTYTKLYEMQCFDYNAYKTWNKIGQYLCS